MKLLSALAPSCRRAFAACFAVVALPSFWIFRPPSDQRFSMNFGVIGSGNHNKIFNAVVRSHAVDVVDALLWIKVSAKFLFHYKAVLKHVVLTVAMWVFRAVYLIVSITVQKATAFPSRCVRAFLVFCCVADNVKRTLAGAVSAIYSVRCYDWRNSAASALAVFGRIAGYLFSALDVSRPSLCCAGVMATDKNLSFVGGAAAPTFAFSHCSSSLGQLYNDIRRNVKYKETD